MTSDPDAYARIVLGLYLQMPDTPSKPRKSDRILVAELHRRSVDLDIVEAALLLGTARRICRPADRPPLPPIRSLAYFMPVVEELLQQPLPPGYLPYLRSKAQLPPTS
jgi:hypothetical protein